MNGARQYRHSVGFVWIKTGCRTFSSCIFVSQHFASSVRPDLSERSSCSDIAGRCSYCATQRHIYKHHVGPASPQTSHTWRMSSSGMWRCIVCSHLLTLVPRSHIFLPWRWRRFVPPIRRLPQDLPRATSQKMTFFIVTAVKTAILHPIHLQPG
jgi:hypothetical protein